MGMSSVAGIAKKYCATLRSNKTKKISAGAVGAQMILPLIIAVLVFSLRIDLSRDTVSTIVTGVSIVAALLCAVATMLFQARVDLRDRITSTADSFIVESDLVLMDELFSCLLWAILIGFSMVLILVLASWCQIIESENALALHVVSSAVAGLIFHFALVIGTVVKRLQRVYEIVAVGKR